MLTPLYRHHARATVEDTAGKYRTGKSFLLNRLIKRSVRAASLPPPPPPHTPPSTWVALLLSLQGAFEVGPTIEACTKGIWLWSEPLYSTAADGSEIALIFVDTEYVAYAGTPSLDARM